MYMSWTGRFALPRVRVVSPRRRGMLCSGKCCHRGQVTGKRGAHFFFKSSSSLSSPLPRKSLKLSAGPSGVVRAREARHVGGRRRRARTERSPDPHTKLSVYSIDIVRLTPRQPEFRTCAPTKRHRKLPPRPPSAPPRPTARAILSSAKTGYARAFAGRAAQDLGGLHVVVDLLLPKRP